MKKILLICFLLAFASLHSSDVQAQFLFMESSLLGKPVPEFKLEKTSGQSQSLTEFRQGKNTIVFFWATWCPHCREQLTVMDKKITELNKKGIQVAAIDLGEKSGVVRSFVKKNKIKLDIFMDEKSSLEEPYGLIGVPTLVFVNQEGIVKAVKHSLPEDVEKMFVTSSIPTK